MSPRLQRWLALSIVVIIVHGIEEYLTGFQHVNPTVTIPASFFMTIEDGIFFVFEVLLLLFLIFLLVIIREPRRWILRALAVLGVVLITELHHVIAAFVRGGYYPGLATAALFPVLAIGFWREFIRECRSQS